MKLDNIPNAQRRIEQVDEVVVNSVNKFIGQSIHIKNTGNTRVILNNSLALDPYEEDIIFTRDGGTLIKMISFRFVASPMVVPIDDFKAMDGNRVIIRCIVKEFID